MADFRCCYCGMEFAQANNQESHQMYCLSGPVGPKVEALIYSLSTDGVGPSARTYNNARSKDMPTSAVMIRQHGSWADYLESIGLRAIQGKRNFPEAQIISTVDKMREEYERLMLQEIRPSLLAMHDWRRRTYIEHGRVYQERYTVLR